MLINTNYNKKAIETQTRLFFFKTLETIMKDKDFKEQYEQITELYDLAEDLAATVENKQVKNPEAQLNLVEPLINDIADSADVLSEEYINILEHPSTKKAAKGRVEKAMRQIFMALENYRNRLKEASSTTLTKLANLADTTVEKIYKQTEKIMIIFMQLIDLSLERIMRKQELDEFRRNNMQFLNSMPQHSH